MSSIKDNLAQLLGDYKNSEAEFYLKLKEKLQAGITLKIKGPKLSKPLKDPMEALYFLEVISKNLISVGYHSGVDHLIKLLFFDDEQIEFSITHSKASLGEFKTTLQEYSAFSISKTIPDIDDNKTVVYKVYLKLNKIGVLREYFEEVFVTNPNKVAQIYTEEIAQQIKNYLKSNMVKRPSTFKTLKTRLSLWGLSLTKSSDGPKIADLLTTSDLGIKDIVQLSFLKNLIFKDNLSNEQLFIQLNKISRSRKTQSRKLWEMINLKK